MRPAGATASIMLNDAFLLPNPEITVKFNDWLKVKEIKVKSLQISNYQMKLLLLNFLPSFISKIAKCLCRLAFHPRRGQLAEERQGRV